jgi:hypothetical protein
VNDNTTPTSVLSDEMLDELRRILAGTDYALVKKDRVRTLSVSRAVPGLEFRHLPKDIIERDTYRQMGLSLLDELFQGGALRIETSPLVSVDGGRRYGLRLDVFMPKEAAP